MSLNVRWQYRSFRRHPKTPLNLPRLGSRIIGQCLEQRLMFAGIPGDFDDDGQLNWADIDALSAEVRSGTHNNAFDVNGDSLVNHEDRAIWVEELKCTHFGDAGLDGEYNSSDLVTVFAQGMYEAPVFATWLQGDWNGDGAFRSGDFVLAQQAGGYETGSRGTCSGHGPGNSDPVALLPGGVIGDHQTSVVYHAATGEVAIDAPVGTNLTTIEITSSVPIFTGSPTGLTFIFDVFRGDKLFRMLPQGFSSFSLGPITAPGLSEAFLLASLSADGSLVPSGDVGAVDLIYVADPSSNRPPIAADDEGPGFTTSEDALLTTTSVLTNDSDADNDPISVLSFDSTSQLGLGVSHLGSGVFAYDPRGTFDHLAVGEAAIDEFNYTIQDGNGGVDSARVSIRIEGANDAPVAVDDTGYTTNANAVLAVPAGSGLLQNDSDVDGDTIVVVELNGSGMFTGSSLQGAPVILSADGSVTYDPTGVPSLQALTAGQTVSDSFSYTIADIHGATSTAVVSLTVVGVGSPTAIQPGQAATIGFWQNNNGQSLIRSLNGGDSDTQLSAWLASTLPNVFGVHAGEHDLNGMTNAEVAEFYASTFAFDITSAGRAPKTRVQLMAVALAVYVTNESLAGSAASAYGFSVDASGLGLATFNVGANGLAFGMTDDTTATVIDLLLAANTFAATGVLYDLNENGIVNKGTEAILWAMANDVFSAINEEADIS